LKFKKYLFKNDAQMGEHRKTALRMGTLRSWGKL
jgi:hypothetical protein